MVKILLADSNALIREGLKKVLNEVDGFEVLEEVSTGNELVKKLKSGFTSDVILIDYTSPGFSIETLYKARETNENIRLIAITYDQSGSTIINALKGGVMSYIKKDCDLDEIRDAVKDTANDAQFFCGKILETIRNEEIAVEKIEYEPMSCAPVSMSERELEIIKMIAEGFTSTQISEKLFLSSHTINTHRKNIMTKLGINNTAGIVMYAVKHNLVSANKFLFSSGK